MEPSRTSTMELFFLRKSLMAKSRKLFSQKSSVVDVRLGSKYASAFPSFILHH